MIGQEIQGFIDRVDSGIASGWVRPSGDSDIPVTVELWSNDVLISAKLADLVRNDIVSKRHAGFAFTEGGPFSLDSFESGAMKILARHGDIQQPVKVWSGIRLRQEKARLEQEVLSAKGKLVILVGKQRSGTTAIGRLIASHPGAFYAGEIFHSVRGPQDDLEYKKYHTVPEVNFFAWRERLFARFPSLSYPSQHNQKAIWQEYTDFLMSHSPARLVIIDVKFNSMHHLNTVWNDPHSTPNLLSLLGASRNPLLFITRSDFFAQAVSASRAAILKKYHLGAGEPADATSVKLDPKELEKQLVESERTAVDIRTLLALYPVKCELEYAKCFAGDGLSDWAKQQISLVTGIEKFSPGTSDIKKLTSSSIRSLTPNADEILSYFNGTPYENLVRIHMAG